MTRYVVDTSVALKWWVDEEYSGAARALMGGQTERLAPDLLLLEMGNALLKKIRLGNVSQVDAYVALRETSLLADLRSSVALAHSALALAIEFSQTMYDATYVALALAEGCPLVTADRRLYNALSPHFKDTMLWVADLPEAF